VYKKIAKKVYICINHLLGWLINSLKGVFL